MKTTEGPIKKEMMIGDIVEKFPHIAGVLMMDYGFHCVGCAAASGETLEEGAQVHGMDEKQIEKMVKDLNNKL